MRNSHVRSHVRHADFPFGLCEDVTGGLLPRRHPMLTNDPTCPPPLIADIIPPPDVVQAHLERVETEANLLRRLLKLSLQRQHEAERLGHGKEVARAG